MTTAAIRPSRHRAPWTEAELFAVVAQMEHASLDTIAARIGRSRSAIEQHLCARRIPRRQGQRTPAEVARDTGYHPRTIESVAAELGLGVRTSHQRRRRRWLSDDQVARIVGWLRENSLTEWSKRKGQRARREKVRQAARERHKRHPARHRFAPGDTYGERVLVRAEVRGAKGRQQLCWLAVCAQAGHASWVAQSEMGKGAGKKCGVCFCPNRVRPAFVGVVAVPPADQKAAQR